LREHSGHIQGSFREHSVCVEVDSEVDAREPPSQLQEALYAGTRIAAEYILPTWAPKTRIHKIHKTYPRSRSPCSPRFTTWPAQYLHHNNQLELC
jgi:hypothetical protein